MKENTNYSKIESIFKKNGGYITRKDVDNAHIPSWFLYDFVKKKNLEKIAPGFYAADTYLCDDYYLLQRRYPKYIFSDMSALYLHGLTDKRLDYMEVVAPKDYNPSRHKPSYLTVRKISNTNIYNLGISNVKTMFGNIVRVYDKERTICDVIKNRDKYDGETFIKAIKYYVRKDNNQSTLFRYARILGIEKKVFEILEVVTNDD